MKKTKKTYIISSIVVLILGSLSSYYYFNNANKSSIDKAGDNKHAYKKGKGSYNKSAGITVLTDTVKINDVPITISAIGNAIPNQQVIVKARVEGLLQKINFTEGSFINKGSIIAKIDDRAFVAALENAKGQLAKDSAQLEIAKTDLMRYKKLLAENSIASQQVEAQEALVKQLSGVILSDNANINAAKLNLSFTNVIAPISGRAGLIKIDAGNIVRNADATGIVTINEIQPIAATFAVSQEKLDKMSQYFQINQLLKNNTIKVEAIDKNGQKTIDTGKIVAIDNQYDVTTGSIKIKAIFPNQDNKILPNQFININLILDTLKSAINIPQSAVQHNSLGDFVYVLGENKKANMRKVTLGYSYNDRVVVVDGIKQDELLIIDGLDKIHDGDAVTGVAVVNKM